MENQTQLLTYKGKPLLRKGDVLYYGFSDDSHIIVMHILESKEENGLRIAEKVRVELQSTDQTLRYRDRVIKKTEKVGLYSAMDFATVWLERAIAAK